jgi:hypothetical protein
MRRSKSLVARTGMFALVAGIVLAACGGGKDSSTTTTTSSSTTTSTSTTTTTVATAVTTTGTPVVTTCLIGQLSAALSDGGAGAGQRYANLVFTNNSSRACTMFGFIGMALLTNNGSANLPTNVVRNNNVTKAEITLAANGGQAFTTLHWSVVSAAGEPQDVQCQPNPDRVQITPPNEGDFLLQPWTFGFVCGQGTIDVNPMRAGAGP